MSDKNMFQNALSAALRELRGYGYGVSLDSDALSGSLIEMKELPDDRGSYGAFSFDESPTGQAAFQQSAQSVVVEVHKSIKTEGLYSVTVRIHYQHHSGGGNGITRDYFYIPEQDFQSEIFISLTDMNKAREVEDFQRRAFEKLKKEVEAAAS